jgi:hypothetical protein
MAADKRVTLQNRQTGLASAYAHRVRYPRRVPAPHRVVEPCLPHPASEPPGGSRLDSSCALDDAGPIAKFVSVPVAHRWVRRSLARSWRDGRMVNYFGERPKSVGNGRTLSSSGWSIKSPARGLTRLPAVRAMFRVMSDVMRELRRWLVAGRSPHPFEPCLTRPAKLPPAGSGWIHEIKHDGFRILAHRQGAAIA